MFILDSDITIGNFRFSGVNGVQIARSLCSISDTAIIKIPSISNIISKDKTIKEKVITGKQFTEGDPVVIKLGYNGDLQTEFKGFVKRRNLNMPLEVECEGYSWLLRRNTITKFWKSVTVKDLLTDAVSGIEKGYSIQVKCEVDFELSNVRINSKSGFDIISNLAKYTDGNVSCFFIEPDVLWCGLIYTPLANGDDALNGGLVNYRLGYNLIKDNSLNERSAETDPVEVKYSKKLSNGDKIFQSSDVFNKPFRVRDKILNNIKDASVLRQLANEKAYRINYSGYEGSVQAFLQPYVAPGYQAYIADDRYPELNRTYLVEGTEVHFGIKGAKRIIEIGPQIGFAKKRGND